MANLNRTFDQLIDAIKTEMQLDPGLISDNERKSFINDCMDDLGSIALLEKSTDVQAVEGRITLPDDMVEVIYLQWGNGKILNPVPMPPLPINGESPVGFVYLYDELLLTPTPTGTVDCKLYHSYRPAHLVAGEDKPEIPNGYDKLVVDFAVALAHRKNGNIGLYREYMSSYEGNKMRLIQDLTKRVNARIGETINQEHVAMPYEPFTGVW